MDKLPPELVVMILPYLSGPDFIHIRQTCTRLKNIADNLEITSRPALWRWYVLRDFPRPCVESVAPWLHTEDKNDAFLWKMLYTSLRRMSLLLGAQLHCNHLLLDSNAVHLAKDVKFFDRHLFLFASTDQVKLVGLDRTRWQWPATLDGEHTFECSLNPQRAPLYSMPVAEMSEGSTALKLVNKGESSPSELVLHGEVKRVRTLNLPWTFSSLPEVYDIGCGDVYISTWTNSMLLYRIRQMLGEHVISVYKNGIAQTWIQLSSNVNGFRSLAFNDKMIIAICENRTICIIPNKESKTPVKIFTYTLRFEAVKVKMLGDLVIVLYADGLLETGQIVTDKTGQMMITDWQVLIAQSNNYFLQQTTNITDFAIHGQIFCAVSANGKVFLSHLESLDHETLKRNLHSPFRIPVERDGSLMSRMSLDASDGLKIAVVETLGIPDMANLHVLYLDICSNFHGFCDLYD